MAIMPIGPVPFSVSSAVAPSVPAPSMPTEIAPIGTGAEALTGAANASDASGFGQSLARAVDSLSAKSAQVNELATQAATGTLRDPSDFLIAQTEASLQTQLMSTMRTKALEAFNEIMRMPV